MFNCKVVVFFLIFKQICALNVINLEISSKVDLRSQFLNVKEIITFLNNGTQPLENYSYILNKQNTEFSIKFYNNRGRELRYEIYGDTMTYLEIILDEKIKPNDICTINCKIVYPNRIQSAMKFRLLQEDQLMKYEGNVQFMSHYTTNLFIRSYFIPDVLIEVSKMPKETMKNTLIYSFQNLKPLSSQLIEIVFVNNDPFLVIKDLKRTITVSHFGKIFIEDIVTLANIGPKFIGPYFNNFQTKKAATNWLYTHLPSSAEDIKYFDTIGNSSQTAVHSFPDYVTLKFKTRYPLLGGWKTFYILQYKVPTYEYLYKLSEDNYYLQMRGIDYVLNEKVIEEATVKIVLPEGASLTKLVVPKYLTVAEYETSCSGGLCVFGRQTIVLKGKNLFDDYVEDVKLEYYFDSVYILRAPLVISFYIQVVFLLYLFGRYLTY